ncbi:conserved exported protein of unknown function [Rhodovastum atsumiense]|uniref:DUF5666 domain-containing protein n=1 Tax=Rhodovastum atsumiense TaxID=504468 RepID=A0A5M6IR63_9PROT|nr:hypothetical protein [Rhodovastum atsumiense]KAA5610028.1 hypothetical protein F1189_21215 [Rhodovastum atsumiense]CAH2602986.1 conserved exported protein of unknown function [Rhodovastum atsumiense]
MSRRLSILTVVAAAAALPLLAAPVSAQGVPPQPGAITSPVPSPEAVTIHAKISAINPSTRAVTLTGANGQSVTLKAGPLVDLNRLKQGDTVNAKYYRSVSFLLSSPGEPVPESEIVAAAARKVTTPGGDALVLTRLSVIVVGIDIPAHSVDVVDPSGGAVRTVIVTDPARIALLPELKVGDAITAVVSEALAVSIQPAEKSWF